MVLMPLTLRMDFSGADTRKELSLSRVVQHKQFYGGAGIGAQGNPIIGEDGS